MKYPRLSRTTSRALWLTAEIGLLGVAPACGSSDPGLGSDPPTNIGSLDPGAPSVSPTSDMPSNASLPPGTDAATNPTDATEPTGAPTTTVPVGDGPGVGVTPTDPQVPPPVIDAPPATDQVPATDTAPTMPTPPLLTAEDAALCTAQLDQVALQYESFRSTYTDPNQVPRSFDDVVRTRAGDWTGGFIAGIYWRLFEHTGDASWRTAAETWTAALASQQFRTADHDIGFIINSSYGNGYRLTGNPAYLSVLQTAAGSLSTRYNQAVGATRSWDFGSWTYPVIIDNMMNLELLFRATDLGGEARFADIASTHATTTMQNHFRADGSSYHVVDYNPADGSVIAKQTNQGLNDESAWARGQAWGLYGFTMAFRETQNAAFLAQAQRIADFYTQSPRMPADAVPYFDFDAPTLDAVPDHRDASAGAIAASGLLELAQYVDAGSAQRYLEFALRAVRSLSSPEYLATPGTNGQFLLMHSVGNYPINDEIDVAISYADYYFVEALLRCAAMG